MTDKVTIPLSDEACAALRRLEDNGVSFVRFVKGLINLAGPYGPPDFHSDVEMERGLEQVRQELRSRGE